MVLQAELLNWFCAFNHFFPILWPSVNSSGDYFPSATFQLNWTLFETITTWSQSFLSPLATTSCSSLKSTLLSIPAATALVQLLVISLRWPAPSSDFWLFNPLSTISPRCIWPCQHCLLKQPFCASPLAFIWQLYWAIMHIQQSSPIQSCYFWSIHRVVQLSNSRTFPSPPPP